MTIIQAVILGLVQGLGEFLPISSSAHLILVPWLFRWHDPGLTFDIALHFGTLLAVIIYFWRDWVKYISAGLTNIRSTEGKLFWFLVVATIPGGVAGLLLEKKAETVFRAPILIAVMLIIMGLILYWADKTSRQSSNLEEMSLTTSLLIGISQALAVIPGVSRSGITMATGRLTGLTREAAARFSFLLSTPIILGAALVKLPHIVSTPSAISLNFIIGVLVSAVTGLISIGFLLRYLQTRDFRPFAIYRFALGALVIVIALTRKYY